MTLVPLGEAGGRAAWTVTAPDGRAFAVFVVDGEHHVTDALCPHNAGPLEQGWVRDGTTLVCPWHWYRFDLRTGECLTSEDHRLGRYPVVVEGGEYFADVPEPTPPRSWSDILRAHAADRAAHRNAGLEPVGEEADGQRP